MSINKVIITGNLTRDPELRQTQSGMAVLGFGMAVNDRRRNPQTGAWEDYPNYVDCTMFGARAESVSQYISKGSKVAVEGKLRWSQWQDRQTGQKRSKLEVVVDEIEFLGQRQQQPQQYQQQYRQPQQPRQPEPQYVEATVYDDEIPF